MTQQLALAQARIAMVTNPSVVAAQGVGKASQAVALSTAQAVQDATAHLQQVSSIASVTIGVAAMKLIEEQNPFYILVIKTMQEAVTTAGTNLATVGATAATIAGNYPVSR